MTDLIIFSQNNSLLHVRASKNTSLLYPYPSRPRPPTYLFILILGLSSITISYQNPNPSMVKSSCMCALHVSLLCMRIYLVRVSFPASFLSPTSCFSFQKYPFPQNGLVPNTPPCFPYTTSKGEGDKYPKQVSKGDLQVEVWNDLL
jgi:hypothetical protein